MQKEEIVNFIQEVTLFAVLLSAPFIGIQSIKAFVLPYNLFFYLGVFVFFVLQLITVKKSENLFFGYKQALLFIFLLSVSLSFLKSQYSYGNKVEFSQIIVYICLAFAVMGRKRNIFLKIFWVLLILASVQSLYSLLQVRGIDVFKWSVTFQSRGFGSLVNPNHFAAYLVLIFPLGLYLFCINKSKNTKLILGVLLIFTVSGIIISASQGGIIAFIVSLCVFIFFSIRKKILTSENRTYLIIIAFFFLIFNFSFYIFFPKDNKGQVLVERIASITEEENPSIKGRILNWRGTWRMSREKFVLGWGPGTYKDVFTKFRPVEFNKLEPAAHRRLYAHNDFLQIISELGIVSFCSFVLILVAFFRNILRRLNSDDPLLPLSLGCAIIAGLTAGFFNTAFTFHYFIMPAASIFWILIGLGLRDSSGGISGRLQEEKGIKAPRRQYISTELYRSYRVFWFGSLLLIVFLFWGLIFQFRIYRGSSFKLKGNRELKQGFTWKAINNFQKAAQIDDENDNYRYLLANQYLYEYFNGKDKKYLFLAKDEIKEAIRLNPYSPFYHYQLAVIYLNEGIEDKEKISYELKKAVELDPSSIHAYILLAEQSEKKKDLSSASNFYRKIYEVEQGNKNSEVYRRLTGEANKLSPNMGIVYNSMGKFFYEKRDLSKSAYFSEKLSRIVPDRGFVYNNLGGLYLEMEEYKRAEQFFLKAVSLEPENIEFRQNLAYTYKITNNLDAYSLEMEEIKKIKSKVKF